MNSQFWNWPKRSSRSLARNRRSSSGLCPRTIHGNVRPDIALAGKLLRWRPTIELTEGLRHTIAYFETLLRDNRDYRVSDSKLKAAPLG